MTSIASEGKLEKNGWLEPLVQCALLDERLPWEEGRTRTLSNVPWLVRNLPGAPWHGVPPLSPMIIRALLSRLDLDADPVAAALHSMLNPDAATDGTWLALQWFHSRWLALKTWAVCSRGGSVQDFYGGGGGQLPADWAIECGRIDEAAALQPADLETGAAVELGVTYVLPDPDGPGLLRVLPLTDGSVVYEFTQVGPAVIEASVEVSAGVLQRLRESGRVPEPRQGARAFTLLVAVAGMCATRSPGEIKPDSHVIVVRNSNLRGLYGDAFCGTAQSLAGFGGSDKKRRRPVSDDRRRVSRSLAMGALRMMRLAQ